MNIELAEILRMKHEGARNRVIAPDGWTPAPAPLEMAVGPVAEPVKSRCPHNVYGWHVEHPSFKGTCGYCGVELLPF